MDKKILIDVFGVKNSVIECNCCSGECECHCNCCNSPSVNVTGEMYNNLINYLENSKLKDKIVIRFIDIANDEYDEYERIADMLEKGFELPFVSIDGEMKLYGNISNELIYEYVEDALN